MTLVLPWRSIHAQARGLGSSMGQQGRSGVGLGTTSPRKEQRETLAWHPQGSGSACFGGPHCFLPDKVVKEGPALTSQLTGYAVGGLSHGAGPGGGRAQGAPRNCSWQARTGSLGPRAALQPPAPLAAEGTRCFLPGRPQPGSSPPSPPRAWRGRRVTSVRKEGRVPTACPPASRRS